jgi:Fic family protein
VTNEEIGRKLDQIIAILQLAHYEDIDASRGKVRADKTNAVILTLTAKKSPAGKLIRAVRQKTGESESTVKRRIATLVDLGALERSGGGPTTAYKATGLI